MFYRKKSLPKEQDRSKNSNPRVHPGADSRFIRAGSSVASHESSQFGSVMDWQQDNRAFDDPFRSHPGSRGGRFPENEHQGNWGSSSWTPEEWSRGIPAAYRGSDRDSRMDCPRYYDGYKGLTNLYPQMSRFGIDGEHFDGSRRGSGADVDFGARYDYSRDKGQSSLFMDSGRGTDYQSNYQAYGRSRFLGSEREESHTSFDLQRGHEPHYEGRRFYNPSKGEYPSMGSESGYGPFDGSNPYLAAREASTSFGSSQRGDSTHYGDSQRGESSFHMHSHDRERGRNPFERQFDVNKWDSYSRSDFRESADSPRGESSFHLRSHDLERSRNPFERQYEDNTRDSYSRSEFRESGDAPHREQWRNVTRSFSDRQTGRDSTLMDELKSKLSADPVTRELVRKDRDLALNIIEKVMEVHTGSVEDRHSSEYFRSHEPRSKYSSDDVAYHRQEKDRKGYMLSLERPRDSRSSMDREKKSKDNRFAEYPRENRRLSDYGSRPSGHNSRDGNYRYLTGSDNKGRVMSQGGLPEECRGNASRLTPQHKDLRYAISQKSRSGCTSVLQRLSAKQSGSADTNVVRNLKRPRENKKEKKGNRQKRFRKSKIHGSMTMEHDVFTGNHGDQIHQGSVLDRLGPMISPPLAKRLKAGKKNVSPKLKSQVGKRKHAKTYNNIPKEALYCYLCEEVKGSNPNAFTNHLSSTKHKARKELNEFKVKSMLAYLRNEARLAYVRATGKLPIGRKNFCGLCKVPRCVGEKGHLALKECWMLHTYQEPIYVCCDQPFYSREKYEEHLLSMSHLYLRYKRSERTKRKHLFYAKNVEQSMKVGKKVGAFGPLNQIYKDRKEFGDVFIPKGISDYWSLLSAPKRNPLIIKSRCNPYGHVLSHFDPARGLGHQYINFTTEFRCYVCATTLGSNRESIIEHCSTQTHYVNVVKKQQKQRALSLVSEEERKELLKTVVDQHDKGDAVKNVNAETDLQETMSEVDIYDDPYANDNLLEIIDKVCESDEADETVPIETILSNEENQPKQDTPTGDRAKLDTSDEKLDDLEKENPSSTVCDFFDVAETVACNPKTLGDADNEMEIDSSVRVILKKFPCHALSKTTQKPKKDEATGERAKISVINEILDHETDSSEREKPLNNIGKLFVPAGNITSDLISVEPADHKADKNSSAVVAAQRPVLRRSIRTAKPKIKDGHQAFQE